MICASGALTGFRRTGWAAEPLAPPSGRDEAKPAAREASATAARGPAAGEGAIDSSVHHRRVLPSAAPAAGDRAALDLTKTPAAATKPLHQRWWFWAG
ncbi:MAG TPA: hypothetical protein VGF45_06270, partial [Polyangia bacterium]